MTAFSTAVLFADRRIDPARFSVSGRAPRAAIRPASREELCEALRAASRDGLSVIPWGGGVALPTEAAPERYDLAIDLGGLDRVVEYEPADLTLTSECGVTLATLRSLLAARGQELPIEAACADRATLGGVHAANASGARRLRFGSPRDRILGARFALGDGTLTRTGGKVVKNVAGYGIHRLLCGSRGGLAILVEATLKLSPAPERRVALVYELAPETLGDAARWAPLPRLEPAYVTVVRGAPDGALPVAALASQHLVVVGLEDDSAWVESQITAVIDSAGEPAARFEGADATLLVQSLADLEERQGPRLTFASPANTPVALARASEPLGSLPFLFHAPAGRLHLFPEDGDATPIVRGFAAAGFTLLASRGIAEPEPPISPQVAVEALRRRIRATLDPARRFALGDAWERGRTGRSLE